MQDSVYHIPALLKESIAGLSVKPAGIYADATFGGGGHSREILASLGENGRLYGFDQDEDAQGNSPEDKRFTFVRGNFRYLKNFLRYYGVTEIDGLLADLGVSFHHFDEANRGFSFRLEGPLDMRMNKNGSLTAAEILNTYPEERLAELFYLYGELKPARRLAAEIVKRRKNTAITEIRQLLEIAAPFIARKQEKKELAQLFQALRIEVNDEMGSLRDLLDQSVEVLKPGGRLVILTYHSLEDRMVKNFFRSGNTEGKIEKDFFGRKEVPLKIVNNKVIVPGEEEVLRNPRSRSAKLRIAEKI